MPERPVPDRHLADTVPNVTTPAVLAGLATGGAGAALDLHYSTGLAAALFASGLALFGYCGWLRPDRRPVIALSVVCFVAFAVYRVWSAR